MKLAFGPVLATIALFGSSLLACSGDVAARPDVPIGSNPDAAGPGADGGVDAGPGNDGGGNDGGGVTPDGGPIATTCNNPPIPAPTSGSCNYTSGAGTALLIRGNLVVPEGYLENAQLLIDLDGTIVCAACDCSAQAEFATARRLECKDGVISPGLINAHDHITYNDAPPAPSRTERYEHRNDWRRGNNGHTRIPSPPTGGASSVLWSELRNLLGGATSVNGSGSARGLLRNLDKNSTDSELPQTGVRYNTFPLDDSDGTTRTDNCNYGGRRDLATVLTSIDAYTPHIAEGINLAANNEFQCVAGNQMGAVELITRKTAIIHGIGLRPQDYSEMAAVGASLIWSPRSNIDLYGNTAQVSMADRMGVRIALGTDWVATGSMNVLRELRCADDFNRLYLSRYFSDRRLVDMATIGAAEALASDDFIGALRPGRLADIAIFDGSQHTAYRAILDATPPDVVLVMRAGTPLYGDDALIASLLSGGDGCEALDVCGRAKSVCVERDTGSDLATLSAAIQAGAYKLFFCGEPPGEPSCLPMRPNEFTGMSMMGDQDGDGLLDGNDNCPTVFNPPRPLDNNAQPDADGDMVGDACDPCPLDADTTACSAPDPNDRDRDGVPNATDNCPDNPNTDQADADSDMVGDVCDACPMVPNPNGGACPATVYQVRQLQVSGTVSMTNMLVTGVGASGYFVQTVSGDPSYDAALGARWSAMFVYTGTGGMKPAVGDRVDLSGAGSDYHGQLQFNGSFTVRSSGNAAPTPTLVMASEIGGYGNGVEPVEGVMRPPMPYESALVELRDVSVIDGNPTPGPADTTPTNEFAIESNVRVDDYLFLIAPAPPVGARIASITGIVRFFNEWTKLEPRSALDLASSPELLSLDPATLLIPAGRTATLTAVLSRTATQATVIQLSSSGAGVTIPTTATVPMGASSVSFAVTAQAATAMPVTVTARLRTLSRTASVRIYDDQTPRRLVALELDANSLPPGGMTTGRLAIDLPAPSSGAPVRLTVSPPALAAIMPSTATIAGGLTTTGFMLMARTATGTASVVATYGTSTATVVFDVSRSTTRPVSMPGDLLITEILYNVAGSTEGAREWFEVYNPTPDTLVLTGLLVSDTNVGNAFMTPASAGSIGPGEYRVFAANGAPASNGGISGAIAYGTGIPFNNGGDRVLLRVGATVINEVVWAAGWPGADGVAICLRAPYGDNSMSSAWGVSVGTFGSNPDTGSPGVASNATNCP